MLKPGSTVLIKDWNYRPAKVVSVGKPHKRGYINVSWHSHYGDGVQTSKQNGTLFHPNELELVND